MLQLTHIKENTTQVVQGLRKKQVKNAGELVEQVLDIDKLRREIQQEHDAVLSESNTLSKDIGNLMKSGKKEEAEQMKARTADLKAKAKDLGERLEEEEKRLFDLLVKLPNVPHESVPEGRTPEENIND